MSFQSAGCTRTVYRFALFTKGPGITIVPMPACVPRLFFLVPRGFLGIPLITPEQLLQLVWSVVFLVIGLNRNRPRRGPLLGVASLHGHRLRARLLPLLRVPIQHLPLTAPFAVEADME